MRVWCFAAEGVHYSANINSKTTPVQRLAADVPATTDQALELSSFQIQVFADDLYSSPLIISLDTPASYNEAIL